MPVSMRESGRQKRPSSSIVDPLSSSLPPAARARSRTGATTLLQSRLGRQQSYCTVPSLHAGRDLILESHGRLSPPESRCRGLHNEAVLDMTAGFGELAWVADDVGQHLRDAHRVGAAIEEEILMALLPPQGRWNRRFRNRRRERRRFGG